MRGRGAPESRAAMLHDQTGGHPWLVYELISKQIADPESACAEVKYQLQTTRRLSRHLTDPDALDVLGRLLRGHPTAPLGDRSIRHNPERHPEARLYYDDLAIPTPDGQTKLRSDGVRQALRESSGSA